MPSTVGGLKRRNTFMTSNFQTFINKNLRKQNHHYQALPSQRHYQALPSRRRNFSPPLSPFDRSFLEKTNFSSYSSSAIPYQSAYQFISPQRGNLSSLKSEFRKPPPSFFARNRSFGSPLSSNSHDKTENSSNFRIRIQYMFLSFLRKKINHFWKFGDIIIWSHL